MRPTTWKCEVLAVPKPKGCPGQPAIPRIVRIVGARGIDIHT
ncbi:Hypothetical protein, putative [Bodo saltans]|uniref:Uncharacterized protein n=1 Tax=Bodo saltans TaxID=75058 RepID=A0A0S4JA75_BODSA|nr:Hypothetical protein, putative [Bodo saltans]|eukprot:CUG88388.1 Hypothetical protein, putative [Bodo saltans]